MKCVIPAADASTHRSTPRRAVRVVLADDECMFRASLRHLLTAPSSVIKDVYGVDLGTEFEVVGEAKTGEETIAVVQSVMPDLLVVDLAMPRLNGVDALRQLHRDGRSIPTVVLAGSIDRSTLLASVQSGVHGFVLKDAPTE